MTKLAAYQETLRQRQNAKLEQLVCRRRQAGQLADQAAKLLKQQFGAQQVMLFGSLAHGHWFSATSDIDLAVWGLDCLTYLTAVAQLQDLSPEFKIDLVRMERCPPQLRQVILQEGQLL
ncbi:MAG: nucleotidyltransferase family protein [Leptolyngbyaceae cyanobacterium]